MTNYLVNESMNISFKDLLKDQYLILQCQFSALKPHKFYHHACENRKMLSKMGGNRVLINTEIAIFADYSQNFMKNRGKSGVGLQYRELETDQKYGF